LETENLNYFLENLLHIPTRQCTSTHRARDTLELLRRDMPHFIVRDLWLPNSPDLNPVNYQIWGVLQERVYQQRVRDVDELRRRVIGCWTDMQQMIIDDVIDEWRAKLRACVRARGGHFEHLL